MELLISIFIVANFTLAIALFVAKMDQRDRLHAQRVRERQEYRSHFRRD